MPDSKTLAEPVNVTVDPTTINARWLLGVYSITGTATLDGGAAVAAANRLIPQAAAGAASWATYPINLDKFGGKVTVGGMTSGWVYVVR